MYNEKRVSDYIPDTEILAQMGEEFAEGAQEREEKKNE